MQTVEIQFNSEKILLKPWCVTNMVTNQLLPTPSCLLIFGSHKVLNCMYMFQDMQEISFEVPTRRGTRTKTQPGAAWWGRQKRRPPPSCKDEEERAPRSNKRPRCPTFRRKEEDSGMGVSLLSSGDETRPAATMEKPCISKPLTSPVLRFICPDTSTHTYAYLI